MKVSMSIIVVIFFATFVAISAASSHETCIRRNIERSQPPSSSQETKPSSIFFFHAEQLCRDMARAVMFHVRITGKFPSQYVKAMCNVFGDDEKKVKEYVEKIWLGANPEGMSVDIPTVDIDKILQEQNDEIISGTLHTTSASVPHDHSPPEININLQNVTHLHSDLIADPQVQHDIQLAQPTLAKTLSPLVDIVSTPISAPIMETSPSNIINMEVQKTSTVDPFNTSAQVSEFQSPSRFVVLGDVDMAPDETTSSLGFTRDGRESRPPIKFQDLEWKTARKGKHGRRGRDNSC